MCSSPFNRRRSVRGCQGWQLSTFCIDVPLLMAKLGETCFSMTPAQPLHQIRDFYGFSFGTTNTWGAFSRTGGFIIRCKKHLFESKAARHHWFPPCVSSGLERMRMQTWINMKWKWPMLLMKNPWRWAISTCIIKLSGRCKNPSSPPDQPSFHPGVLGFFDAGRFTALAGRLRAAGFFIALLDVADFPISPEVLMEMGNNGSWICSR